MVKLTPEMLGLKMPQRNEIWRYTDGVVDDTRYVYYNVNQSGLRWIEPKMGDHGTVRDDDEFWKRAKRLYPLDATDKVQEMVQPTGHRETEAVKVTCDHNEGAATAAGAIIATVIISITLLGVWGVFRLKNEYPETPRPPSLKVTLTEDKVMVVNSLGERFLRRVEWIDGKPYVKFFFGMNEVYGLLKPDGEWNGGKYCEGWEPLTPRMQHHFAGKPNPAKMTDDSLLRAVEWEDIERMHQSAKN